MVNLYKKFKFYKIKISIIQHLKVTAVNKKKTISSHILGSVGFSLSNSELDNVAAEGCYRSFVVVVVVVVVVCVCVCVHML